MDAAYPARRARVSAAWRRGVLFALSLLLGLAPLAASGGEQYVQYAVAVALLSGLFQVAFGVLRLGVLMNLLSHPVLMGFVNAAAILIGLSQLASLLGLFSRSPLLRRLVVKMADEFALTQLGPEVVVRVESTPSGATVTHDGEVIGKTPLSITVERGAYEMALVLEHAGFAERQLAVFPVVDLVERVTLDTLVRMRIVSRPPGAEVTADGEFGLLPIVCLGHCEMAPCLLANERVTGPCGTDPESVRAVLQRIRNDRRPA